MLCPTWRGEYHELSLKLWNVLPLSMAPAELISVPNLLDRFRRMMFTEPILVALFERADLCSRLTGYLAPCHRFSEFLSIFSRAYKYPSGH